ncbi:MAG: ATP-binding cassette domain-containing protein [Microthrixaceae bacterium]|nr:ATP-binding cassette domain-containing protein [Microthrixaceae bacterium]
MIEFRDVTLTYPEAAKPTLTGVNLEIEEGELCLVAGRTGVGKSTLLGCINGLVPHFTGGHLRGAVLVDGRSTADHPPRELAEVVGVVGQDPLAGFVTDTVEEELAYAMEQLAVPSDVMRKRVEETLDLLGIAELRSRSLRSLSGGQQQRVAIGSVLTAHPRILVLDEPTSALDPTAAEEVLGAIMRLVHDLGVTVVIAEHRLERVLQYADRVLYLPGDGSVISGTPTEVMEFSEVAPPVVQLGRLAGWSPLPLSVRDARRRASELREALEGHPAPAPSTPNGTSSDAALHAEGVLVTYGDVVAVRKVDLDLFAGSIVAMMGRNGSGKSSLMWALQGSGKRDSGTIRVFSGQGVAEDPAKLSSREARQRVGLVPQTPGDLLYLSTVAAECTQADVDAGAEAGECDRLLERLVPGIDREIHPRDLSEGQRLALVLAIQLTASPAVILLDEPTRGLDYGAKTNLAKILGELAASGRAVMVSTHDVEFVATCADRVVVMAQGEVVANGPTAEVVVASPAFAPQVAKILYPSEWLNVAQVAHALEPTR